MDELQNKVLVINFKTVEGPIERRSATNAVRKGMMRHGLLAKRTIF